MSDTIRKLVASSAKGAPKVANPTVQAPSGVQGKFMLGGHG